MTDAINRHLADAARARGQGRRADEQRSLAAALALDADHPVARNALGMAALQAGNAAVAAGHFGAAAARDPNSSALWLNLAKAHRISGHDEGERSALERALAADQTELMAIIRMAELHERLSEHGPATDRWSAVLAMAGALPDNPPELASIIGHARAYVGGRRASLADALDQALATDLAAANPRDRRRMMAASGAMLGRRSIFANQCEGLHYPFLPADEYFDREHFPWFAELEAATATIRAELQAILASGDAGLAPYVQMEKGTPQNKWSVLDGSTDWSSLHLWREGTRIDAVCARAPKTAALIEALPLARIPQRAPTVFFSILKAGSHIPAHTGVTNSRTIVHLPLIVPPGCSFRVGGEMRDWREGEAFAFDDTIEHEAWNRSEHDRAVLILDCWNPHLSEDERRMIVRMFDVADQARDAAR